MVSPSHSAKHSHLGKDEKDKIMKEIAAQHLGGPQLNDIVWDYLARSGYAETFNEFNKVCPQSSDTVTETLSLRSGKNCGLWLLFNARVLGIRELITCGNSVEAYEVAVSKCPQLLAYEEGKLSLLYLKFQIFVEMLQQGRDDDAIVFAQQNFSNLQIPSDVEVVLHVLPRLRTVLD